MSSPSRQPTPLVDRLHGLLLGNAVDHANFRGPPIDIADLSPHELGRLWPAILAALALPAASARFLSAQQILQQAREHDVQPVLDAESALAVFSQLQHVANAIVHLPYLACAPFPALAQEMRRILGDLTALYPSNFDKYFPFALAQWADEECRQQVVAAFQNKFAHAPFLLQEFALLPSLKPESLHAINLEHHYSAAYPAAVLTLQDDPAYAAFALHILPQAVARLLAIHRGEVAYQPDGAFVVEDTAVLARAVRVAALRDEPELAPLLRQLLTLTVVPPAFDASKTLPSQSLALKLGQAMAEVPTPEGVQALLVAYAAVRHAGVKKKLERCLKPAQRGLGARPELALRLLTAHAEQDSANSPATKPLKQRKQQQNMLALCLEASYWREFAMRFDTWQARFLNSDVGLHLARSLIWRSAHGSFMLQDDGLGLVDSQGQALQLAGDVMLGLWHPLHADLSERSAWQGQISERKIRQPFRQAFREFYELPANEDNVSDSASTDMFAGHVLNISSLIGLARKEGWKLERNYGFSRQFGAVTACFSVGTELYPGMHGTCCAGELRFEQFRAACVRPVPLHTLAPLVLSEVCRAVDLLVSVTSFALDDEALSSIPVQLEDFAEKNGHAPTHPSVVRLFRVEAMGNLNLNQMANMRRLVLQQTFATHIANERLQLDERRAKVGDFCVHLNTGRVSQNGAQVEIALPSGGGKLKAVPWLPYDEVLLEKIVRTIGVLLQ